ncbi:fibril protein [Myxococcus sp. K15C18031901]|uniref:fibril protein n=1 Tax=Myxococcus dinghuensis TaxID=2906761 RepID=UPI0020A704EE|nr:fibril protein [Myxococcus dinghuensis]MCP3099239.1 fibril protein [Myxococcus dinghuensis]
MKSLRMACLGLLTLAACASSNNAVVPEPTARASARGREASDPNAYGYRKEDPVRVGWGNSGVMAFFELLRGPDGERVAWRRLGPCCDAPPQPEYVGLEVFEVSYEGMASPVRMFIDPNHGGTLRAPRGFTIEGLSAREPRPAADDDVIEL